MNMSNIEQFLTKLRWILLGAILVLAIILRFWQLGVVPVSPDWDEVALGYNAYSILHTARDEYGVYLPVVMRSFDDYKPALYSYIAIPSIAVFGLNVWSVRFPSAVFGVLTILALYFLVKELFKKDSLALLSSFLLTLSPWHIQFSRIAFESNVGLGLNVFGALFFVRSFKKPWFLFPSIISFVASAYVYQSEKVFSPLLLFALVIIFRKELLKLPKRYLYATFLIGFILSLPMMWFILTNKYALERAQGVSIFSGQNLLNQDAARLLTDQRNHDYLGLFIDNRRFVYAKEIVGNYMTHWDLNWLFIAGDISRHHAPNMGLLYLWELPFVLVGIYFLIFGDYDKKTKWTIFAWYLLAPIAASVTTGVPHAVRTLNFLPMYQIFTAIGIFGIVSILKKRKLIFIGGSILVIGIAFLNTAYYFDQYFVQQNYYNSADWQYGYAKAVAYVKKHPEYKHVVVSNQPLIDQSYMFFLFYLQYDPAIYQNETSHVSGGFSENHQFGRYEFRPIHWSTEKRSGDTLYVGRPSDFGTNASILETIHYFNGDSAIEIVR